MQSVIINLRHVGFCEILKHCQEFVMSFEEVVNLGRR